MDAHLFRHLPASVVDWSSMGIESLVPVVQNTRVRQVLVALVQPVDESLCKALFQAPVKCYFSDDAPIRYCDFFFIKETTQHSSPNFPSSYLVPLTAKQTQIKTSRNGLLRAARSPRSDAHKRCVRRVGHSSGGAFVQKSLRPSHKRVVRRSVDLGKKAVSQGWRCTGEWCSFATRRG